MDFNDSMELTVTFTGVGRQHVPVSLDKGDYMKKPWKEIDELRSLLEAEREDTDKLKGELAGTQEQVEIMRADRREIQDEINKLKEEVARLREQNDVLRKEKTELTEMLDATYRGLKCVQKIQTGTADMSDLVSGLDATLSMLKIAQAADDQSRKGDS